MPWTTDDLVESVRARAAAPVDSGGDPVGGPTAQDILDLAHEVLLGRVEPAIRNVRENYGLTSEDVALAVGDTFVRVPARAQADTLQLVILVDTAGRTRELGESSPREWPLLDPTHTGSPVKYLIEGNKVQLWPTPSAAGETLRLKYFRRASRLVPVSECRVIVDKQDDGDGNARITLESDPPVGWAAIEAVDIVQRLPGFDLLFTGVASFDPESTGDDHVADLATEAGDTPLEDVEEVEYATGHGDYMCLYNETCVPQVPAELHPALAALTAAQLLSRRGDQAAFGRELALGEQMLGQVTSMMRPRTEEAPNFIINRSSPLRQSRRRIPVR